MSDLDLPRLVSDEANWDARMTDAARRATAAVLWLFLLIVAIPAKADGGDPLGTLNAFGIPIESRSFDQTLRRYVMGGVTYEIPRNYLVSLEEVAPGQAHEIYMDVLLPNLAGFTRENAHCFLSRTEPCNSNIVRVGITQSIVTSTDQQIRNLSFMLKQPEPQIGKCGFQYFESKYNVEITHQGFNYFVRALGNNSAPSILRCPKDGAQNSWACNAAENLGDGNSFYYVFDRRHVCQWEQIEQGIAALVRSFTAQGDKQ